MNDENPLSESLNPQFLTPKSPNYFLKSPIFPVLTTKSLCTGEWLGDRAWRGAPSPPRDHQDPEEEGAQRQGAGHAVRGGPQEHSDLAGDPWQDLREDQHLQETNRRNGTF